jgi:mannose-6-phosphate isomerase-like protein (cupin superfamily)
VSVGSGDVIFGEAGEPHRFEDTGEDGEDLELLLFFAPREGARSQLR